MFLLPLTPSTQPSKTTPSPPSFRHRQMEALSVNPSLSDHKLPYKLHPSTVPPPLSLYSHLRFRPSYRPHNLNVSAAASAVENQPQFSNYDQDETYGEVKTIIGSRALEDGSGMEYLIEWEDDHVPTWVPANLIAADVIAEYESPWWIASKKADDQKLKEIIDSDDGRDVKAVDPDGRTALLFVAGLVRVFRKFPRYFTLLLTVVISKNGLV